MKAQYFVQGLFLIAGTIALCASLFNWNWFFDAKNAQFIVKYMGRQRARLFYGSIGILCIGMTIFIYYNS